MHLPLISVITVSYNAKQTIEQTIISVINQTYPNIEYIIIDGGSVDGTIDIIKKYDNKITKWISEPDKGIYDAMNKGINIATGKWINFMNCGDSFYSTDSISQVVNILLKSKNNIDVIYGNCVIDITNNKYMVIPKDIKYISDYLPFCHQSTFVKTFLAQKYPFDLNFKFVADYNFFYQIYNKRHVFFHFNQPLAYYQIEQGFTASNMNLCIKETYKVNGKRIPYISSIIYTLKSILLKILPQYIIDKIRNKHYQKNSRFIPIS